MPIPNDAVPITNQSSIPNDAIPVATSTIPNDAVPINPGVIDATPIAPENGGDPSYPLGNPLGDNVPDNSTWEQKVGAAITRVGGNPLEAAKRLVGGDVSGALSAASGDPWGALADSVAAIAKKLGMSDTNAASLGRDVYGLVQSSAGIVPEAAPETAIAKPALANEAGTAARLPADAVAIDATASAPAAKAASVDTAAQAAETGASGAPAASPELQARINGLFAGDKQIMTPEQLQLLQSTSAKQTQGAAAALDSSATEPIVKEGLSRNVVGAFRDMLQAGDVTMVPGIKPTDQVLALMRSDILPPETYNAILKKWGVSPVEVVQSALGEGMRASSRVAGQTLQQLSDLQKTILKMRAAAGETGPEIDKFLASQTDDVGNNLRSVAGQVRGIWQSTLVGQLATSMRNALTAVGTAGVDTLARAMDGTLRGVFVNPARSVMGAAPIDDPIGAFANWNMLLRSAGRLVGVGDQSVTPYAITKAITNALPTAKEALFGRYASDVTRATGGAGILGRIKEAADFLNFHGRFQEFVFRRAFFSAELQRRLEARGLNLDNVIRSNRIGDIPEEDIAAAAGEALRLTYGRPLGNSGFDSWMRAFNQVQTLSGRNPFPPIPFVRFMADAMKWQFEHSPFGAARLLTNAELRAGRGGAAGMEVFSRALAGSAMLYGAFMLRNSAAGGSNWYSVKLPGMDSSVDVRAFSPLSNYLFVADLIKRATEGTLAGIDAKQLAQGLIGANFRAGAGLYLVDDLISQISGNEGAASKIKQIVATWAGDALAGFLTPFETLKDMLAQFNPEERIVRDQRQSPLTAPAVSRIPFADQTLPPLVSPTRAGPIEEAAPLVKQITGVTVEEEKNAAEKELARLGIQKKEILPSSGDPAYDRQMATFMGPLVERAIGRLVAMPGYQAMNNAGKGLVVSKTISLIRNAATKAMPPDMAIKQQFARKGMRERIFLENLFSQLPPERRDLLMKLLIR